MELIFEAYSKDTTSLLGTLTAAFEKQIRVHYNGPGEGSFKINRHDSQAAWCVPDNYIRAYLDSVSNPSIFGFFIGSGEDVTVSFDEEGGEILTRAGPGSLSVLSEAIIDPTSSNTRYQKDGNWHWTDKTMGTITKELIDDAHTRSALSLVTYDFTGSLDSDGASWDTFDGEFELSVGMQVDEAVARLQSAGFIARMTPDFLLQAYKTLGTDRSGSITFARGTNITSDAQREVFASAAKSRMLVQGTTKAGALKFVWATDATVETALGRRKEGFVPYQSSASNTVLGRVGQQAINRLKKRHDGLNQIGVLETVKVPFTDYFPGDTVNVNIPGEFSNVHAPITAIGIFDMENGDAQAVAEFEDVAFERLQLNDKSDSTQSSVSGSLVSGPTGPGASNGGCGCPPFALVDCTYTTFDDFNRTVASSGWGAISSGGTWTRSTSGSNLIADVNGTEGRFIFTPPGTGGTPSISETASVSGPFNNDEWTMRARWYWNPVTTTRQGQLTFWILRSGTDRGAIFLVPPYGVTAGGIQVRVGGGVLDNQVVEWPSAWGAGWYMLEWIHHTGTGTHDEVRVWPDGATRPSAVLISVVGAPSADYLASPATFQIRGNFGDGNAGTYTFAVDYIEFADACAPTAPAVGQEVHEDLGLGDGVTVLWHTGYAYEALSLRPTVDDITDSDFTETDPALRQFTFGSAPASDERVRVTYQAA